MFNDREALLLVGMEGDTAGTHPSRPEHIRRAGRWLYEDEFNHSIDLHYDLKVALNYLTIGTSLVEHLL